MMWKTLWIAAACLATVDAALSSAFAQNHVALQGAVLKLSDVQGQPLSVNVGGLVVAIVRDSGSRPPQDIRVEAPRAFQPLGKVRGTQNDQGRALMGGGYTWYLFSPVSAGQATIKVGYTENGDDGKRVERTYRVTVERQD